MDKIYLITFNPGLNFNHTIFHKYISELFENGHISDWWHYIDNTYLIRTSSPVNTLYNIIYPGVPQRYLFIIEVNPENSQGWLPKEAWTWIQKYQQKK